MHKPHLAKNQRIGAALGRCREYAFLRSLISKAPDHPWWYTERLAEAGIEPSVGSKGDSYENAMAETINGLYQAELIHRRAPWKTKASVELATLEWMSWFNHHRVLEPIGYIPPAESEANYYRQLASYAALAMMRGQPLSSHLP